MMTLYHGGRRDKAVEVYFKPTATPQERLDEVAAILNSGEVEAIYPVVNRNPMQLYIQNEWYLVDDLVLVRFTDPREDSTDIADFMGRYGLAMYHSPPPTLPDSGHYTYVFRLPLLDEPLLMDYIEFARMMVENETGFVENVTPNIVNYAWAGDELMSGNATQAGSSSSGALDCNNLNDTYSPSAVGTNKYRSWHIDNQGFTTNLGNGSTNATAVSDADADICECWTQGYSGQGIKIALLGDGFFLHHHPDLAGAQIPNLTNQDAFDCRTGNCLPYTHTVSAPSTLSYTQGLTQLASTLVSQHGNATGTVGVAPNTKIYTFMTANHNQIPAQPSGYSSSAAAIVAAIHEIIETKGIDITVTNLVSKLNDIAIASEFANLYNYGRSYTVPFGPHGTQTIFPGMPVVASPGREYQNGYVATTADRYPAAYDQVIGVITSTPSDSRKTYNDGWSGASSDEDANYGSQYDVAAPGTFYMLNSVNFPGGTPFYLNAPAIGKDCAPALVGGIAAMLLEKNFQLTGAQVRAALRSGADKTGGYNYVGGVSQEFAYGRVSCSQSIQTVTSVLPGWENLQIKSHYAAGALHMDLPESVHGEPLTLSVYDALGRLYDSENFVVREKRHTFALELPTAVYFLCLERNGILLHTSKFVSHE